jgi:hypothetical protein
MASNLACIGLAVPVRADFARLVKTTEGDAEPMGRRDGIDIARWEDPSGARVVLAHDGDQLTRFQPSFAAEPGAELVSITPVSTTVSRAQVVDASGKLVATVDVEPEQQATVRDLDGVDAAPASLIAFATDVAFFADADAYAASPRSLVDEDRRSSRRYAPVSFEAYGAENEGDEIEAYAHLAGTVRTVDDRRNHLTAQRFLTARVATLGFEVTLCAPLGEDDELPAVGSIAAGTVFLGADLLGVPHAEPTDSEGHRHWFGR